MNIFRYKGFIGSIEANAEDKILYGKLLYINEFIKNAVQSRIQQEDSRI